MLVIDGEMFKLAKMQERLLKVTDSNKEGNLANYKKTVTQIDSETFNNFLEEIRHFEGQHNHSLEEELQILENIKKEYEQLMELQLGFVSVCEQCGDTSLKLSDLSQLNIEYIESRISTVSGYLLNLRNIEINTKKIQELSDRLVEEEKKKDYLSSKLEQLELALRESFLSAEGRIISNGSLQYTSVINEYKGLEIDFAMLLSDVNLLKKMIFDIEREKNEISEKHSAAEICYNNFPNAESKQILDEIRMDFLNVKYKFAMLKILELLSTSNVKYDSFREKREKLLDLIKYRLSCLETLGVRFSIDPFSRTQVNEQLKSLTTLTDNAKAINKIKKELSQLTIRTEEMINQNVNYKIALADTKELLISKVSIGSIDISGVQLDSDDEIIETFDNDVSEIVEDNQVVSVRLPVLSLNMVRITQKARSVIRRVNQMINEPQLVEEVKPNVVADRVSPELVIVPHLVSENKVSDAVEDSIFVDLLPDEITMKVSELEDKEELLLGLEQSDIFETVVPFEEPVMFGEKSDDSFEDEESDLLVFEEIPSESVQSLEDDSTDEMPDAFWVTDSADDIVEEFTDDEDDELSFDAQIDMLLSESVDVKTRKLDVDRNKRHVA